MKIVNEWPPNIDRIREHFDVDGKTIYFTYGSTIYNPTGKPISKDYEHHEEVHCRQQMTLGPDVWWEQYLTNPEFRLEQEVEAYGEQLRYLRKLGGGSAAQPALAHFCKVLSSPTYGNCIDIRSANTRIMRASV